MDAVTAANAATTILQQPASTAESANRVVDLLNAWVRVVPALAEAMVIYRIAPTSWAQWPCPADETSAMPVSSDRKRPPSQLWHVGDPALNAAFDRPLVYGDTLVGRFWLPARAVVQLSPVEQGQLAMLIETLTLVIGQQCEISRLRHLAFLDPLTGLANRRAFQDQLLTRITLARDDDEFAILLIDVDHFKQINDSFGHAVGDRMLCRLADTLQQRFRQTDVVARYGGEEFAILLPDTHFGASSNAIDRAEPWRQRLNLAASELAVELPTCPGSCRATVSGGIALFPHDADTMEGLLDAADQALYRAKRAGRNRLEHFGAFRQAS